MAKKEKGIVEKKEATKKVAPKKPKSPKVTKIMAQVRITHKDRTYEVGEIIEESDKDMIKQIVDRGWGRKVN